MNLYDPALKEEIVQIDDLKVSAYAIPTDFPESDGTIEWNSTTLVLVELKAGGKTGIGYTYAAASTANFISDVLKEIVMEKNVFNINSITQQMIHAIRNQGQCGIAMMAVSAVDTALWDLKAKILDLPLCNLLGKAKDEILLYGSGGFTSYSDKQTQQQFENWADQGVKYFKMKIAREPAKDVARVKAARKAIGDDAELFVDANGGYNIKQATEKANEFSEYRITWFEEPVTSDNLKGLNFIREHSPLEMNITAGEYGYNLAYFESMLDANAVDILQADATRCGGITGFLKAGILCEASQIPFSSHCAPALHMHAALALPSFFIAEYFHDHERIEKMFFDGVIPPVNGKLKPDLTRAGMGIEFLFDSAEKFRIR